MATTEMEKILAAVAIERALIDVCGTELHDSVKNWLYTEYLHRFSDCLENPKPLRHILEKKYGDKYIEIVQEIKSFLGDASQREPFLGFMKKLKD